MVFFRTFIVIFWGCVFGRSAAVGLNAAFISTALQWSVIASCLSVAVRAHTGWYSWCMGEIWRGSVCDGRARDNHACFFFNETETEAQSCLLFSSTGGVWTASSTDTEPQRRSVLPSQVPAKHSKTATLLFTRGNKLHQKKWTIRTQLWARGQTLNTTSQEKK